MPFTQIHKINIGKINETEMAPLGQINLYKTIRCDGCDERCVLDCKKCLFKDMMYPMIGDKMIEVYIDNKGNKKYAHTFVKPGEASYIKQLAVLNQARYIACLCDNYKTK